MPSNRELLAALTFEPYGAIADSGTEKEGGSDGEQQRRGKYGSAADTPDADDAGQTSNTDRVVQCLKLALHRSIVSISEPAKERPLNPAKDFNIASSMIFSSSERGGLCCGAGATRVRRPPMQRADVDDGGGGGMTGAAGGYSFYLNEDNNNSYCYYYNNNGDNYNDGNDNTAAAFSDAALRPAASGGDGLTLHGPASAVYRTESFIVEHERALDAAQEGQQQERWSRLGPARAVSSANSIEDEWGDARGPTDFEFIDFAPMCYRHIREFFHIEPKAYLDSLLKSKWHSIPTPGKSSAQLFFCGRDWVIKSMRRSESRFLRDILHRYYYHVRDNPYTLLPHFVGHHRLELGIESMDFIIMKNVFATTNSIDEKFDLKGSTVGRYATDLEKLRATCTQKDLDIHSPIHVGPQKRRLLMEQIKQDCDFLRRSGIMDYYLLVGIHVLPQPRARVPVTAPLQVQQQQQQQQLQPQASPPAQRYPASLAMTFSGRQDTWVANLLANENDSFVPTTSPLGAAGGGGIAAANRTALPDATSANEVHEPDERNGNDDDGMNDNAVLDGSCFTTCQGGMLSDETEGLRREIYYIGIIDILQEYDTRKAFETFFRGIRYDRYRISCVPPNQYAARFIAFVSSIIV